MRRLAIGVQSRGIGSLELIQSQPWWSTFLQALSLIAISSESRCSAKSLSILNRLTPLQIFHGWWTYLVNHTVHLHPLHSVHFYFCASIASTERPYAGRPRVVSFDDPSTKMSISVAKKTFNLRKTSLYLQEETLDYKKWTTKSGTISTESFTTISRRI